MGREAVRPDERATASRVVGREAELAAVAAFLDARPLGPAALVIEGEAGIGKTTIVRVALARAVSYGARVFAARPAAGEMELPYAGLGDLLATVTSDALGLLAGPQRAAIEAALAREGSSAAVDEPALSRGVLELLRLEGAVDDLLLVVDDVQWLDRPTVSAVSFALRRLGSVPIRVCVAARTVDGSSPELPLGLADWEDVRRLVVGPLPATELGSVLGQHRAEQLPRPRLEALARESGGNPMFALELVRQGYGERAVSPVPTLSLAVEERLQGLDVETRRALAYAAAALRPSSELLRRAGVEPAALESALEKRLIAVGGERLSFAHPLVGAVAYDLIPPNEHREIHARLAAASTDAVERGHHVSRSVVDPDESAAETLEHAAEEAANLGDHSGAATFLRRAVELSPVTESESARRREVRAAIELELAGDVGGAADLARGLIARLPSGIARARTRQTLVSCSLGSDMSFDEALTELSLAIEEAEGDEALQAEIHLAMHDIAAGMCRLDEARVHAGRAIELAEAGGATSTAVVALGYLGLDESLLGHGITEAARRALARWDGTIFSPNGYSPRMALGFACINAMAFGEAEQLFNEEIAMANERGLEGVEVYARGHLAQAQLRAGRWAQALTNARVTVEHARQAANAQTVYGVSYSLAMTQALLGQHDEARAIATEGLSEAEAAHDFWFRVFHPAVLGLVALAEDDTQAAVGVLEPAWGLMLEHRLGDLSIFPVAHVLGEALVAVGRIDDALAVAETLDASPVGTLPWCRAMANRCMALAGSARADHDSARTSIAAALEAHAELPEPFEHARTLQVSGRVERNARNWGAARVALVDALQRFDDLGAARWAEKTAAEIARLPGRRPADRGELTTREREVAELVAAGLANKEIAARLFVSLRTVEANLSKVYAKLGVRSRTELAARLNRPGD